MTTPNNEPSILWIVLDSLRADRLGCYGYDRPISPNIDRLAGEGLRFETAISQGGYSLPSFATMLTGLYPSEHGCHNVHDRLRLDTPLAQEVLSAAGYVTANIGGNPFMPDTFGLERGFDHTEYINRSLPRSPSKVGQDTPYGHSSLTEKALRYLGFNDQGGLRINDAILDWTMRVGDRPWFCFAHYMETHEPYAPPLWARWRWRRSALDTILNPVTVCSANLPAKLYDGPSRMWQAYGALYDAEVAYNDWLVGKLIDGLAEQGRLDNLVIVLASDHGDFLGERGLLRHYVDLGEAVSHVPLIIWWPDRLEPRAVDHCPVELRDVPGSLCLLAGADGLAGSSRSSVNLLDPDSIDPARAAFAERAQQPREDHPKRVRPCFGPDGSWNRAVRMLRDLQWEYLEYADGEHVLYDVREDPAETTDLSALEPGRLAEFELQMKQVAAQIGSSDFGPAEDLPDDVEARLRDLGYL